MKHKLNWQAYANNDRNKIIEETKGAISTSDGHILNFNVFSFIALSLSIEIEENRIQDLHKAISRILNISDYDVKKLSVRSKKEWLIFLNISFSSGKGELSREIW
jgi:hypothetical protein